MSTFKWNNQGNLVVEGAKIIFLNFEGRQTNFNPAGARNFCLVVDNMDLVDDLQARGWNVKQTKPRDPRDRDFEPTYYVQVKINMGGARPPKFMVVGKNNSATELQENELYLIDHMELENVDLVINPWQWEVNGKTGIKAYLKSIYLTQVLDDFEGKYSAYVDMKNQHPGVDEEDPF